MRKLAIVTMFISVFAVHSAFAQNLGKLSGEQLPQKLVSAAEFQNFLKSPDTNQVQRNQDRSVTRDRENYEGGGGYREGNEGYHHEGYNNWGGGYGSYYPYYNYFPNYYGSYYYPNYGYGYGYGGYWADEQGQGTNDHARPVTNNIAGGNQSMPADAAHSPVVCFASDNSGNWFANADLAANVSHTQESTNRECSASGGSCHQNLGCAVAYGDSSR